MADFDNTVSAQVNADAPPPPEVASNPDAPSSIGFNQLSGIDAPATPVPDAAPAPTPAPAPAPAKSVSKWEAILTGALQGMVGGAGQKFFGTGMAAGGAAVANHNQQQTENKQRQQQIDIQQQGEDREQQMQPYRIKFMSAQAASMATDAALHDKQLHSFDADHQNLLTDQALSQMKTLQDLGIAPTLVVANNSGGKEAMAGMEQLTDTHGAVPPMFTLNLGNQIVSYDLTQVAQAPQMLSEVNKVRAVTGQTALTPQAWAQLPDQAKLQQTNFALGFYTPLPDEKTLAIYKNYLTTANAAPESPEKAANVAKLQGIVANMQTVLDEGAKRANKQDVDAKNAVISGTAHAEAQAAGEKAGAVAAAQNRATGGGTDSAGLTGEDYLKTLNPARASLVMGVVNGGLGLSSRQLQSKDGQALAADVLRVFPDYDVSKQDSYVAVRKEFTKGKAATQLNAGGTALQHLADLKRLNTDLSRVPGTADHKAYNNLLNTVVAELSTFYHLPDTDTTIKNAKTNLGGFFNRGAAIDEQIDAMTKKLDGYQQQWDNAIPSSQLSAAMPNISEDAKKALAAEKPDFVQSHPSFAPKSAPSQAYKVGDPVIQGGHTFTVTSVDANGKVTGAR
jgi:hypothetical protein